jgi:proline iminopeptidase
MSSYVAELEAFVKHLGLKDYILLGHSWGTMVVVDYVLKKKRPNLKAIVLASPMLSVKRWSGDAKRLIKKLPKKVAESINSLEAQGLTDTPEYKAVDKIFNRNFVFRRDRNPKIFKEGMKRFNLDIYNHMWGPSEFNPTGTLKSYERISRLREISQPTLVICGRHDESTPESCAIYAKNLKNGTLSVVPKASHMLFIEEPEVYYKRVNQFLDKVVSPER